MTDTKQLKTYAELKSECVETRSLYVDKTDLNIQGFFEKKFEVVWKRPTAVTPNPVFVSVFFTTGNIIRGKIGNRFLAAALYNMQLKSNIFSNVIPEGQNFEENYAGIFNFRFWHYGKWLEVFVDDLLPYDAKTEKPLFSTISNDSFWCPLLEKAFAKFHGSYTHIKYLTPEEILSNFTGGLSENIITMKSGETEEYSRLLHRMKKKAFAIAHTMDDEDFVGNNFICNHIYVIISVEIMQASKLLVPLLQLRDPSGVLPRWNGSWSNSSIEWIAFPKKYRESFINRKDDACFWISYEDFMLYFDYSVVCNYQITKLMLKDSNEREEIYWDITTFEGKWIKNKTAGGLPISESGYTNPKFKFEILKDEQKPSKLTVTLISLTHNVASYLGVDYTPIGFYVYKINEEKYDILWKKCLETLKRNTKSDIKKTREISMMMLLKPGKYIVIPCTMREGEEGDFLLRIYTEFPHQIPVAGHVSNVSDFDTSMSLVCPSEIELGQPITISLVAINKGPEDLIAMANLGFFTKTYRAYKPIKSHFEHITLAKKSGIEITMNATYNEYGSKIDDHSLLCAVFEVEGIESKFFEANIKVVNLKKPRIEIDLEKSCITPSGISMVAVFKNPLPIPVRPGYVFVQGDGIKAQKIPFSELTAFGTLNIKFNCTPEKDGILKITVMIEAIPLGLLKTTVEIAKNDNETKAENVLSEI